MAKFVKLEKGGYINVDAIRFIKDETDIYLAILGEEGDGAFITEKDLENILKVSEER